MDHHRNGRLLRSIASLACVALLAGAAGCGSDSSSNNNNGGTALASKTFSGTLGDGSAVSLTFGAAVAVQLRSALTMPRSSEASSGSITGTITPPGGQPITVTGTWNADGTFSITAGAYTLSGSYANGAIQGTCTKNGVDIGFVAVDAAAGAPTRYCGTYTGSKSGPLTFIVSGGTAYAILANDAHGITLKGTVTGGSVNLGGNVSTSTTVTVTGTVGSGTTTGDWVASDGNRGTWSVSTDTCSSPLAMGSLCDKAATVGANMTSKLQACSGMITIPPNGGIPGYSSCMTEVAQCTASDAAALSTFLDCLNAIPAITTCSTDAMTAFGNAADACSATVLSQLSSACVSATGIN